jgi:hypothetical protein
MWLISNCTNVQIVVLKNTFYSLPSRTHIILLQSSLVTLQKESTLHTLGNVYSASSVVAVMLPPHIAERTRLRFDHEWFTEHSWANVPVHTSRSVVGSLVFPRVGTRTSFDAEQKNRHQTHRRSHSARMPNIPRARRAHCLHIPTRGRAENVRRCVEVA